MKSYAEVKEWVESRYGPITHDYAAGVCVAVVGLYGDGKAIGLGSIPNDAVVDLYLDLHAADVRDQVPRAYTDWERNRRQARAERLSHRG